MQRMMDLLLAVSDCAQLPFLAFHYIHYLRMPLEGETEYCLARKDCCLLFASNSMQCSLG